MAQSPSPLNPFLGSTPHQPERPARETVASAPDGFRGTPSPLIQSMAEDLPVEDVVATPTSKWRHRVIRRGLVALVLVALVAGILLWWFRGTGSAPVRDETPLPTTPSSVTQPATIKETEVLTLPTENANFTSEHFKAGEIVVGGELEFLMDDSEVGALTVENIRGEAFTEKNKQEVKLVVTWTTSKLAQASVRYSKGIGQTERSLDETDYSYNHSVIISGLDPASTYLYTIDAVDRYGNRVQSEPHAVFTGARTVSLFDLIAGAIGEVFGWAVTNK